MEIIEMILQGLLGLAFLFAGSGKLFGLQTHKESFENWRLPQWFRVVTGLVEAVAAIFLIIGYWIQEIILYGALIIIAVGIGGVFTHLRAKDSAKDIVPITVLGLLGLVLILLILL